jgi:general stress protein 26
MSNQFENLEKFWFFLADDNKLYFSSKKKIEILKDVHKNNILIFLFFTNDHLRRAYW